MSHGLRGAVSAWLALIVLQTVSTKGGSGQLASLFSDVDQLVRRALDPNVPAIPDLRDGATAAAATTTTPYTRPPDMPVPAASPNPTQRGTVGRVYAI